MRPGSFGHLVRAMHHRIFGVGDLLLGPALDVKLVRKRAHGFAEFSTGLLDVGLKFVDAGVGTGFGGGPSVVAMAGVLDLFDVEFHAVNRLGGGRLVPVAPACG